MENTNENTVPRHTRPICSGCPYWEMPEEMTARVKGTFGKDRKYDHGMCQRDQNNLRPTMSDGWCPEHPDFEAWKNRHWPSKVEGS